MEPDPELERLHELPAQAVAFLCDATVEATVEAKMAYLRSRFGLSATDLFESFAKPPGISDGTWRRVRELLQLAEQSGKHEELDKKMRKEMEKMAEFHRRCVSELTEVLGVPSSDWVPPDCPVYRPAPRPPPQSEAEQTVERRLGAMVAEVLNGRDVDGEEEALSQTLQRGVDHLRRRIHRSKSAMAPQVAALRTARAECSELKTLHRERAEAHQAKLQSIAQRNKETARAQRECLTGFFADGVGVDMPPELTARIGDGTPLEEAEYERLCASLTQQHSTQHAHARDPRFYRGGKLMKQVPLCLRLPLSLTLWLVSLTLPL